MVYKRVRRVVMQEDCDLVEYYVNAKNYTDDKIRRIMKRGGLTVRHIRTGGFTLEGYRREYRAYMDKMKVNKQRKLARTHEFPSRPMLPEEPSSCCDPQLDRIEASTAQVAENTRRAADALEKLVEIAPAVSKTGDL